MSLVALLPMIGRYHKGDRTGATVFFTEHPDLLAWSKGEIIRIKALPERGQPPKADFVSEVHRAALERMVAEFEEHQKANP